MLSLDSLDPPGQLETALSRALLQGAGVARGPCLHPVKAGREELSPPLPAAQEPAPVRPPAPAVAGRRLCLGFGGGVFWGPSGGHFLVLQPSYPSRAPVPSLTLTSGLQPARLPCPWDSPGVNAAVGCHALRQESCPTPGLDPSLWCFLLWQVGSLPPAPPDQAGTAPVGELIPRWRPPWGLRG